MDVEDQAPKPPKRSRSHKAPTRGNVANLLGLKVVTPRSIAYIAVQVWGTISYMLRKWLMHFCSFVFPFLMQVHGAWMMVLLIILSSITTFWISLMRQQVRLQKLEFRLCSLGGQGIFFFNFNMSFLTMLLVHPLKQNLWQSYCINWKCSALLRHLGFEASSAACCSRGNSLVMDLFSGPINLNIYFVDI